MKNAKSVFVCSACGGKAPRWHGKCATCGAWNSLVEEVVRKTAGKGTQPVAAPVAIRDVPKEAGNARLATGIGELDNVLGGGFVAGSVILFGGDPGVGKSTLLLQALAALEGKGARTLYVTGEESAAQVALRAERLAVRGLDAVRVLATTNLADVEQAIRTSAPAVAVIDSVQTIRSAELESPAGTVSQLREVSEKLTELAKQSGTVLVLVGHVTKDGTLAGPKVLEHLVDVVLSFEGDHERAFRVLRASKNRFGASSEVGIFEMVETGLAEVADPSALFLRERPVDAPGSVVVSTIEGSRPLLVEVQALVAPAVYGASRRVTSGVDSNRAALLLAVLDRRVGLHVVDQDVFVSTAGGVRAMERAVDLGLALAMVSSFRGKAVPRDMAVFGEVGLAGEVRAVGYAAARVREALKFGYRTVVLPESAAAELEGEARRGATVIGVKTLADAIDRVLT
jgi:DNA repair protein RadA/Sms